MRVFEPVIDSVLDSDGSYRFGSYRGRIPSVDLSATDRSAFARMAQRKHWQYFGFADQGAFASIAILKAGYFSTTFAHYFDANDPKAARHVAIVAPSSAAKVDSHTGAGSNSHFSWLGRGASFVRAAGSDETIVTADFGDFRLEAVAVESRDIPPITAVASLPEGRIDVTEKHAGLAARFDVSSGATKLFSSTNARAGRDLTVGFLPRRTRWTWCLALGTTDRGESFGINLVEGFVGEAECCLWLGDEVVALDEGRFEVADLDFASPFAVRTKDSAIALEFTPFGHHHEQRNLGVLKSNFVQRAGHVRGSITLPSGRRAEISQATAVVEQQDTTW